MVKFASTGFTALRAGRTSNSEHPIGLNFFGRKILPQFNE